jgi:cation:H+ antiporter
MTAMISPMVVQSQTMRREFPALFLITALTWVLVLDDRLDRLDGIILFSSTFILLGWLYWLSQHARKADPLESEFADEVPTDIRTGVAVFWTIAGLVLLIASSQILVWGAVNVARDFGISDLVIGLTIIAVGTSLPEVAVSISAAIKKEHDMVIGNIIGSNMFNLLTVLGLASMIEPADLSAVVLERDFPVMLALTVALFIMSRGKHGKGQINRIEASLLLSAYGGYLVWLYFSEISTPAA